MLATNMRFHGHGSLKYVFKNADAYRSHYFTIKAALNPRRNKSRFAVVVSKKVHKSAVGRNRMRRRVYEILRHEMPLMTKTADIAVIIASSEVIAAPHEELSAMIHALLDQAGLYR